MASVSTGDTVKVRFELDTSDADRRIRLLAATVASLGQQLDTLEARASNLKQTVAEAQTAPRKRR
jgi:prefoldin subunit 5